MEILWWFLHPTKSVFQLPISRSCGLYTITCFSHVSNHSILIPKISNYTNTDSDLTFSVNRTRKIKNLEKSSKKFSHRPKSEQYIAWFRQYIARNWQYIAQNWQYIARSIYWQYIARKVQYWYWYWYCNFWKTNIDIDIDIANINILLQYIAQQYIDLYPCSSVCQPMTKWYTLMWNPL